MILLETCSVGRSGPYLASIGVKFNKNLKFIFVSSKRFFLQSTRQTNIGENVEEGRHRHKDGEENVAGDSWGKVEVEGQSDN